MFEFHVLSVRACKLGPLYMGKGGGGGSVYQGYLTGASSKTKKNDTGPKRAKEHNKILHCKNMKWPCHMVQKTTSRGGLMFLPNWSFEVLSETHKCLTPPCAM